MALLTIHVERARRPSERRQPSVGRRRGIASLGVILLLGYAALGGLAGASTPTTPSVYTAISPVRVLNQATLGNHGISVVVANGTTVPSLATSVQMLISLSHGKTAGTLEIYPTGGAARPAVQWAKGQRITQTLTVPVGTSGKVTLRTAAAHTVAVTARVIGYYSAALVAGAVTAGDLDASGATAGQVLTATGSGAQWQSPQTWQPPATTYTASLASSDFLWNSQYVYETSAGSYTEYFTRYADVSIPALTQSVLDNGSVQVFFQPSPVYSPNQWLPLPYQFDSSFGYTYNYSYVTSPGQVEIEFYFIQTDPSATLPTLSSYALETRSYKVVVTPGAGSATDETPALKQRPRPPATCTPFPGGEHCTTGSG
jgi:hypothetical protein